MRITSPRSAGLMLGAICAVSVPGMVLAQQQDAPPPVEAAPPASAPTGQAIVVNAPPPPADLTGLEKGPDVEGIITARRGDRIQITGADQANTVIAISQATEVRGRGGFLGLNRTALTANSLLNGLPVTVETVNWNGTLVGKSIRLRNDDLKTANMIRNGTAQGFAEQTAATAALRSRVGNIDQYNVRRTTNVYFDTGKWNLSPQAEAELCSTATEANSTENALLLVVGYTDAVGSEEVNQTLSERRAGRVVNYLQQKCRWAPYRMLTPSGMAEADPAADNSTAEGRRQNRRVSVSILVSKAVEGL
ncbi:OmpA family protein [Pseudonocardia sp. TMWB2A]|uniref:OmpA family protein n=1 Tax=Pseudonocardia sp. TMWB2A TaxID=687430 RepID=UPI00307D6319